MIHDGQKMHGAGGEKRQCSSRWMTANMAEQIEKRAAELAKLKEQIENTKRNRISCRSSAA